MIGFSQGYLGGIDWRNGGKSVIVWHITLFERSCPLRRASENHVHMIYSMDFHGANHFTGVLMKKSSHGKLSPIWLRPWLASTHMSTCWWPPSKAALPPFPCIWNCPRKRFWIYLSSNCCRKIFPVENSWSRKMIKISIMMNNKLLNGKHRKF